jgi:3-deoxy-7-phosphoheptulonate synthase
MLESFLVSGRQDVRPGVALTYGQSITDACMDWDTTRPLLEELARSVRARRTRTEPAEVAPRDAT